MNTTAITWAYETDLPEPINGTAHSVLLALCYSLNYQTNQCNPSIQRLAHITRFKPAAIKKALRLLREHGIISLSSGKRLRKSNNYVIKFSKVTSKSAAAKSRKASALQQPPPTTNPNPPPEDNYHPSPTTPKKPIGRERALDMVADFMEATYPNINWDDNMSCSRLHLIAAFIELYSNPTRNNIKILNSIFDKEYGPDILSETCSDIHEQIEKGAIISDMHRYVMKSLTNRKQEFKNRYQQREKKHRKYLR